MFVASVERLAWLVQKHVGQRESGRERERNFPLADLLSRCPQQPGPCQVKAGSQELNPSYPRSSQEPEYSSHNHCLPGSALGRSWGLGTEPGSDPRCSNMGCKLFNASLTTRLNACPSYELSIPNISWH